MFKITRKIFNQNRTYKKSKEFASFDEAYEYADKYTRTTYSIYKVETEIFDDGILIYTLDTDGNEKDMRTKEEAKKEYTIYREGSKLFTKDNLKDAKKYAEYWSKKDRLIYSIRCSDGQEFVFYPPEKIVCWYVKGLDKEFKTLEKATDYINRLKKHKKLTIYKVIENGLLNNTYIKHKTVQAL